MKMEYQEITELYRKIGRELRRLGADRVVLLNARSLKSETYEIQMEAAVLKILLVVRKGKQAAR